MMQSIKKSNKLNNVCYDIRGPVLKEAKRLEDQGHRILRLNIGYTNSAKQPGARSMPYRAFPAPNPRVHSIFFLKSM